jgi:hypothetical protein
MRRLAVALSFSLVVLTLIPAAASARGPQKNDSVNGHGFVVFDPTTTYEFRVSAHTISTTTTAGTGNMFITATQVDPITGQTITISIWADVYCVAVATFQGEVRGHIYRTEPDLLTGPTDLVFDVTDASFTNLPDLFGATTETAGAPCVLPVTTPDEQPVAKGDVSVNDEGP